MPTTDSSNGSPQKWLLSIGIDQYPLFKKKDKDGNVLSHKNLNGCVNDAKLLSGVLQEQFGFPPEKTTFLSDEAATRDGILAAMNALVERIDDNDIVVVTYAGHGSLMPDREGDEADGKDSTIVPYDSGRVLDELNQHPNRDISDDEIYIWLKKVTAKTPYVTLIFDCCKSGTIARDIFGEADRWVEEDTREIDDLPPSPLAAEEISLLQRGDRGESGWLPVEDRYVLIAGCGVVETAGEYRVPGTQDRNGLMTYFLTQELKNATPGTTYRDVYERMMPAILANAKKPQHPQMEGTRDRELFGVRDIRPMNYVKVTDRTGKKVLLAAGGALGMMTGSEWTVYPEGTKEITDEIAALGRVKITAVHAVTSDGEILEETAPNAIKPASRAVETVRAFGDQELLVQVVVPDDDLKKAFIEVLKYSYKNLLRLVPSDEGADARVYLIPPRTEVQDGDPVPQIGRVDTTTWAVVGSDGDLVMPLHARDEQPNPIVTVLDNLSLIAKVRRVHTIVNNKKPNPLDGNVRVVLKKELEDGTWVKAEPEKNGMPVYKDGDNVEITMVNDYEKPVYVSLLVIALDNSIQQIYPPAQGANEALAPNTSYDVSRQGYGVPLPFKMPPPATFPDDEGVNTFILFVTLEEADFSGLTQGGVRDADELSPEGLESELGQLLSLGLIGSSTRFVFDLPKKKTDQHWTAVKAGFILQR